MDNVFKANGALLTPYTGTCDVHGAYETFVIRGRVGQCTLCRKERERAEKIELDERERLAKLESALDAMKLRGRFRQATFETFEVTNTRQADVREACMAFADEFQADQGRGLWLIGPVGTGKTHLGCAIAQAVRFQRNQGAVVMTAREIVRELRETWHPSSSKTEAEVIRQFGEVPLLVLDEVGTGFGKDAELTQLFDVVDARYQRGRPTVVISNLDRPAIKAALGDRIFDRLREDAVVLACEWSSHRAPAALGRQRANCPPSRYLDHQQESTHDHRWKAHPLVRPRAGD